jgi:hypothetical protein
MRCLLVGSSQLAQPVHIVLFQRPWGASVGNVYATLWGLITFSGFVITLLLPQADKYAQLYFETVTRSSLNSARKWVRVIRQVPILVLVAVVTLAVLSPIVLRNESDRATAWDFALLAVAVVAEVGFVLTARFLVPRVPGSIETISPVLGARKAGLVSPLRGAPTAIRFVNRTSASLQLNWVDFEGSLVSYGLVPAGSDGAIQSTYTGHWFTICETDGRELASFEAQPFPAIANIDDSTLRAEVPEPRQGPVSDSLPEG